VARIAEVFSEGELCWEVALIFLTVGTWYKGYDRLVEAVDELVKGGIISDAVTAQIGYGFYKPAKLAAIKFCSPCEFSALVSRARFVISHAGMGTIIEAIKQNKPVIVLPRRRALGEASNDHQFITARQLETEGKILVAYDVSELPLKIEQAGNFVPAGEENSGRILQEVERFIENLAAAKCA
jgi:UDP-N-acetylglucosamine transferase subunit ALG13